MGRHWEQFTLLRSHFLSVWWGLCKTPVYVCVFEASYSISLFCVTGLLVGAAVKKGNKCRDPCLLEADPGNKKQQIEVRYTIYQLVLSPRERGNCWAVLRAWAVWVWVIISEGLGVCVSVSGCVHVYVQWESLYNFVYLGVMCLCP